jgi:hypothetical protein
VKKYKKYKSDAVTMLPPCEGEKCPPGSFIRLITRPLLPRAKNASPPGPSPRGEGERWDNRGGWEKRTKSEDRRLRDDFGSNLGESREKYRSETLK